MDLLNRWAKFKDDFHESIDGVKEGVAKATFGSFTSGVLGEGEEDVESPSEKISKMPIFGGEITRKFSKEALSRVSKKSNSLGKIINKNIPTE